MQVTDTIGPYEIRGELGRGAMAVVWRGWDPRLQREVAIKEPLLARNASGGVAEQLAARFVQEAKAVARLSHPGIVCVFAADVYDGRPAIVMELVEGSLLTSLIDAGTLDPGRTLSLIDQLLDAVGYAHAQGVIHRDIKPDNIFVTAQGRVKLADFGIARLEESATMTQAGTMMGTPGYMSPEQVTGSPVDSRSDLFAVGAIAHEMLTGNNPYGATEGLPPTTVMHRIVNEPVPVLPPELAARVPPYAQDGIRIAMAKNPQDRFDSAQSMRAYLSGSALAGAPPAPGLAVAWGAAASGVQPAYVGTASPPGVAAPGSAERTRRVNRAFLIWGSVAVVAALLVAIAMVGQSGGGVSAAPPVPAPASTAPGTEPNSPPGGSSSATPVRVSDGATTDSSSELGGSGGTSYSADRLLDHDNGKCWAEGVGGYGVGQWFRVDFGRDVRVTSVGCLPGYMKRGYDDAGRVWDRWWSNGRVKEVMVEFSDGTRKTIRYADQKRMQRTNISPTVTASWVKVTIRKVYPARNVRHRAPDTSVSEFGVWGVEQ